MKKSKRVTRVPLMLLAFLLFIGTLSTRVSALDIVQDNVGQMSYPALYGAAESGTEVLEESVNTPELRSYLVKQFAAFESCIDVSQFRIPYTDENEQAIMEFIWYEIPEAFQVGGLGISEKENCVSAILVSYQDWCSVEEYQKMCFELQRAASVLLDGIENNEQLTDVEKALLLHDRLAVWNEYDYANYLAGTIPPESYTAYGALVKRTSVCDGYTKAYMYLLNRVGIHNIYCSSGELWHSWNIVYIDGTPYHVDVTWDDQVWDVTGRVYHENFLVSSKLFYAQNHNANDYNTSPQDSRYDNSYWRNSQTAFQLVDNALYFIDNKTATLNQRYKGTTTNLLSVEDAWKAGNGYTWAGNYSKLSSDGSNLLLSLSDAVYEFNIRDKTLNAIYHPDLSVGENFSIYGFTYADGYLICDLYKSPNFASDTKTRYQVKQAYDNQAPADEEIIPGETLVNLGGTWYYFVDGEFRNDTTLVNYYGTWYYVENGVLNWNYTSLVNYYGTWYYVENGILNWDYTGLVNYYGTWYYVENGILNWNYTGLTNYYGTWYYVENGILNWNYTGLTNYFGTWYYVENGVLNWGATTLVNYYGTWYYVENGVLNWGATTLTHYYGTWYYVENGVLNWSANLWFPYYGTPYHVVNGVVVF